MEKSGLRNAAMIFVIGAGIVLLMIYARNLFIPLMIGAYLAMLLVPLVTWMEIKKIPRGLAILISILICLAVIVGLGWFFTSQISSFTNDLTGIEERFNQITTEIEAWVTATFGIENTLNFKNFNDQLFTFFKKNASTISGFAFSTLGSLGLMVIIPVYIFMFLFYRDHFSEFTTKLFSHLPAVKVLHVITDLRQVIQKYISGMLKVMVILAILNGIGLLALGIKHAIFFAVFAAILNVVPYIGPLLGSIVPMTFALLTKDSLWYPVGVFVVFSINQTIEGNYLTPKIVGSNVSINPITSIVALFIGGLIWGVVGMILFIPLAAIIKKLLELSPSTQVYGFLLGEQKKNKKDRFKMPFIEDRFKKKTVKK